MKLLIASDIHGSAFYAKAIVEKYKQTHYDALIVLGDVYNHGPRNPFPKDYAPMEVAQVFGEVDGLIVIQGNCDSEVDQMISSFQFVRDNVLPFEGRKLFFTHGHIYNKRDLPNLARGDVMFYGHFHISEIADSNGITCVNVGSCALPKDGENVYCVFDDGKIEIRNFDDKVIVEKTL